MKGIDVSEHNGVINWDLVKSEIDFAILRLGWIGNKNNHTLDKQFERNYNECKRLSIPVGVYVYSYCVSEDSARNGANWTVEHLKGKILDLPVYIDMEEQDTIYVGRNTLTNICIAFNSIIENSGRWAGVYANLNWFNNYLNKDKIKRRYTTWIAHYGVDENKYNGEYDILQYTSNGYINGIGRVDLNKMYRNLINEIKGNKPIEPTKPEIKDINIIADEVINGKWGNGEDRKNRLTQAGYNYNTIQDLVNSKLINNNVIKYTVKKGDSLSSIANKFNTTWQNIYNNNKSIIGNNPNLIRPGQILNIKK